jgi:hypothetical protein
LKLFIGFYTASNSRRGILRDRHWTFKPLVLVPFLPVKVEPRRSSKHLIGGLMPRIKERIEAATKGLIEERATKDIASRVSDGD